MWAYLGALALTLAIEIPIYSATLGPLARALGGRVPSWPKALVAGTLANLASHPLAFVVVLPLADQVTDRVVALVLVEIGVLVLEAAIIQWWLGDWTVALIASSLANVASLSLGVLLIG